VELKEGILILEHYFMYLEVLVGEEVLLVKLPVLEAG
jgi:hypothetical protein